MVAVRIDLVPQLGATEHHGLAPEVAAQHLGAPLEIPQVTRLRGETDPAPSRVAAVGRLARDQGLDQLDRLQRRGEQRPGPLDPMTPYQLVRLGLVAWQDEP